MARIGTALALLAAAPAVGAFSHHPPVVRAPAALSATATEDTDFDAPLPANPQSASAALDHDIIVVDDECYLGKYGQYEDCVDFDPLHAKEEIDETARGEMPSFGKLGEEIAAAFKNSPLGKIFADN